VTATSVVAIVDTVAEFVAHGDIAGTTDPIVFCTHRKVTATFLPAHIDVTYRRDPVGWSMVSIRLYGPQLQRRDGKPAPTAQGQKLYGPASPDLPAYAAAFTARHQPRK
jgi:hypothetical protein